MKLGGPETENTSFIVGMTVIGFYYNWHLYIMEIFIVFYKGVIAHNFIFQLR
jgi:hypothetical protein